MLELLASGLSFDLTGLTPAEPGAMPQMDYPVGYEGDRPLGPFEAITLAAGMHLAGGEAMLPVVRMQTGLAASLADLPGLVGIAWHPARTLIEPAVFRRQIGGWLAGGAFPSLSLAALARDPDGGMRSVGLDFFIGQELRIEPVAERPLPGAARLAVRLIHALVEDGPVDKAIELSGDDGKLIRMEPSPNGRFIRAWMAD